MHVAVDCVVFGWEPQRLQVLLVRRRGAPHRGRRALPGALVRPEESLEEAARRTLRDRAGVGGGAYLEQLYTFGDVGRDPRGRVVSVAWLALVRPGDRRQPPATAAAAAEWHPVAEAPPLPFDHDRILATARERLRGKVRYQPVGFELLPPRFTLRELQGLYETILDRPLDKRNFRKKILGLGLLTELDETQRDVPHRAARLYAFDRARYERLRRKGVEFAV